MKKLFLVMAFLGTIFLVATQSFASRALKVVADLDHNKGTIGTYRALLIGIQNYNDPKIPDLQTPLNDVKAIAEVLQNKYGFKVETLLDGLATRKGMYDALRNLSSKTKSEDSVLIYYAGHGDLDRQYDDGWWIPANAKGGDSVTYLDNGQIQKAMRSMKAKHVLLISDSCYSGTLFGNARAMPSVINDKYYLNLYNEKSRWGMTSGNKTPVSDSGTGGNSVFAYQLIKKLKNNNKPYISTQEIYTDIAPVIANNSEQQPLCRPIKGTGDQGGEFIFVATTTASASEYQPNKISALLVAEPENRKISFDDIVNAEERQAKNKTKWGHWQTNREDEYSQVKRIDKSTNLNADQKKEAWLRFSSGLSQDNPFSTRDDEMRIYVEQRISYFEKPLSTEKEATKQRGKFEQKRQDIKIENKNLMIQKEATHLASIPQGESNAGITGRDGHYIKYENGVVYDTKTGLMWASEDNGKSINWKNAKRYCDNYQGGGYKNWRMPTKDELAQLYDNKKSYKPAQYTKLDVHLTELIRLSTPWPWASSPSSDWRALYFGFDTGIKNIGYRTESFAKRALPVRMTSGNKTPVSDWKNEQKPIKLASINPAGKQSKIVAQDGQYVKFENGIVYDKNTGLEWCAGPDRAIFRKKAVTWVASLELDGGGWRMPSRNELKSLYNRGKGLRNMTSLIVTNGWFVWSSEQSRGFSFSAEAGLSSHRGGSYASTYDRAFAVRKKK